MFDWLEYFEKPSIKLSPKDISINSIGRKIHTIQDFDDSVNYNIAIIGVPEERNAVGNKGCAEAPDRIREALYKLIHKFNNDCKIIDFGNLKKGHTVEDTYFALSNIIADLVRIKVFPVILGGANDLAYANYLAYERLKQIINIVSIDAKFDIKLSNEKINSQNYLNHIVLRQPNFLFNFSNIGYQTYFIEENEFILMQKLYFDAHRVGSIREKIEEAEAIVRNCDMLSIDISAVRQSDAPANEYTSPNGFYGEEICQIVRYAGMSDRLSSAGIYEMNPTYDNRNQTANLIAQMIWYLIDGIMNRQDDIPKKNSDNFIKYIVKNEIMQKDIIFYKSKKTNRWWLEISVNAKDTDYQRNYLIACTYEDYLKAQKNEIPDRLWYAYQKIL